MSSTLMRILEESQKRLQGMNFAPVAGDMVNGINPKNIVIWKTGLATVEGEESLPQVQTPGLVITPPKEIRAPVEAGTNVRDDTFYPILIQLIATDGQERYRGLPTYAKWIQQIRRAFNNRSWPEIEIELYGDARHSIAEETNVMDQKIWKAHEKFLSGVAVVFIVRETRGIEV